MVSLQPLALGGHSKKGFFVPLLSSVTGCLGA